MENTWEFGSSQVKNRPSGLSILARKMTMVLRLENSALSVLSVS
jgi:hypothetical protein